MKAIDHIPAAATPANAPQRQARIAGVLYVVIIVLGIWSEVAVRSANIVPGDPAATAANIRAAAGLFRLSFAADTLMALSDAALAVLLFLLLRPVSHALALTAMVFRLLQTTIVAFNMLNQHVALLLLTGAPGFEATDREALAALFLDAHGHGYDLGLIFFGVNCLLIGWLVARSGFLPQWLGWLVMAAGPVYLIGSYTRFVAPEHVATVAPFYVLPLVAEVALALWLLVKGIDRDGWKARNAAAA